MIILHGLLIAREIPGTENFGMSGEFYFDQKFPSQIVTKWSKKQCQKS